MDFCFNLSIEALHDVTTLLQEQWEGSNFFQDSLTIMSFPVKSDFDVPKHEKYT